jgi:hypothetical protein
MPIRKELRSMANPLTCLHNIFTTCVDIDTLEQWLVCVSCNTPLTKEWIKERGVYEYDMDNRVWVYVPAKKD